MLLFLSRKKVKKLYFIEGFRKLAESILKAELINEGLEINAKENGRKGVEFIVIGETGKQSEIFLQR